MLYTVEFRFNCTEKKTHHMEMQVKLTYILLLIF